MTVTIPTVPKQQQTVIRRHPQYGLALKALLKGDVNEDELRVRLDERFEAGEAKYGTSWCEVDLREDLREEILDSLNYVVMMTIRMAQLEYAGRESIFLGVIGQYLLDAYAFLADLPDFEGPTSKDYVSGDPDAQARFDSVLRQRRSNDRGTDTQEVGVDQDTGAAQDPDAS